MPNKYIGYSKVITEYSRINTSMNQFGFLRERNLLLERREEPGCPASLFPSTSPRFSSSLLSAGSSDLKLTRKIFCFNAYLTRSVRFSTVHYYAPVPKDSPWCDS